MSKGLEALEHLGQDFERAFNKYKECNDTRNILKAWDFFFPYFQKELDIIEKELKECENYKVMYRLEHEKNQQLTQANLKMLKALEIIKPFLKNIRLEENEKGEYEILIDVINSDKPLVIARVNSKEEYDLLKEVLL